MKTLLWAVAVLAFEVLLFWGYFAAVGQQMVSRSAALASLASLVVSVSAVVWLGFDSGFGRILKRLLLAMLGCVALTYAALVAVAFVDLPTALVCERGRTEVEATPTIPGGRFEEYRVGPCAFFNPESRGVDGLRGSGGDGD